MLTAGMTVGEARRMLRAALLPRYGEREAAAIAGLAFQTLKGWTPSEVIIRSDWPISEWLAAKLNDLRKRVVEGEPIQYVLGEARFYGMDLKVSPATLIPRPETAELVDIIVRGNPEPDLRVLDIGTGSGAIAIALSRNLRFPEITAIDLSEEALRVAEENADRLKAKIRFIKADIFNYEMEPDSLDIIVSNPPYIAEEEKKNMETHVVDHEPASALFVPDSDPVRFYIAISAFGKRTLRPGGKLYFELNPRFANDVKSAMESEGFEEVRIEKDSFGKDRFAIGINKG